MSTAEQDVAVLLEAHTGRVEALTKETHLAYWESATTGSAEAAERYARESRSQEAGLPSRGGTPR